MENLNEELLAAWLKLSSVVNNERIVSTIPFNEAHVCNLLYRRRLEAPNDYLTATDLCGKTRILKSQMNKVLASLERRGLIERFRARDDRRKLTKVEIICKESRLEALKNAMTSIGITGMTVSHVMGCGAQKGKPEYYRGIPVEATLLPKVQVDIVVSKVPVRSVIDTAKKVLYTGHIGDGKIFVYDVENAIKVRTGEEGYDALQDVE